MSVHSCPVQGAGNMDDSELNEDTNEVNMETRSEEVGASMSKVRKSYFPPQSKQGNTLDGERSERANTLYMSRASYISILTRIRSDIENHLKFNGKLDQIDKMLETYEKIWRNFVDTHEKIFRQYRWCQSKRSSFICLFRAIQIKA